MTAIARDVTAASLDAKIAVALEHVSRALRASRQQDATRLGLSRLQLAILVCLAADPPPEHHATALARELDVRQPTVSDAIKALEAKGLVTRAPLPASRRITDITLTANGREALGGAAIAAPVEDAIATLDETSKEHAFALLVEIVTRLNRSGVLGVARTCPTCDHFRPPQGADRHPRCGLLEVDLTRDRLQIDCPDHRADSR